MATGNRIGADGKVNGMIRVREAWKGVKLGVQIGKWTVLGPIFRAGCHWQVACECECGAADVRRVNDLLASKHYCEACERLTWTDEDRKLQDLWYLMIYRCHKPDAKAFKYYGARGVSVYMEWRDSFTAFRDWAISNGWKPGLDIDRWPDNNGNYEPGNCRFVTHRENCNNRRSSVFIEAFNERKTPFDWENDARSGGANARAILGRVQRGWEPEKAITTPLGEDRFMAFGLDLALFAWSKTEHCKTSYTTLCHRVYDLGWDFEKALTTPSRKQTFVSDELREHIKQLAGKMPQKEVAKLTGVSETHVSRIVHGKPSH